MLQSFSMFWKNLEHILHGHLNWYFVVYSLCFYMLPYDFICIAWKGYVSWAQNHFPFWFISYLSCNGEIMLWQFSPIFHLQVKLYSTKKLCPMDHEHLWQYLVMLGWMIMKFHGICSVFNCITPCHTNVMLPKVVTSDVHNFLDSVQNLMYIIEITHLLAFDWNQVPVTLWMTLLMPCSAIIRFMFKFQNTF